MTKQQIQVIKESIKISPRVALSQYKQFTREDVERKNFAKRNARLVNILTK